PMSSALNPSRKASRGLLAAVIGLALVVPAQAQASGDAIWSECVNNGSVSTNHTQREFTDALTDPPADGAEYTDCLALIGAAQKKAAVGGSSPGNGSGNGSTGGGTGSTGSTGGTTGGVVSPGAGQQAVAPEALQKALSKNKIDPAAPVGAPAAPPAPSVVGGETVDLSSGRLPSIANAFSLPLPLAASAVVVLFSAALPVVRFAVGRFGTPPTGTTTTTP
ncbi:MAG: hypothetical protein Q7T55_12420, partial [Solirubrobacteraceae bacterium]|nr:hypothetical protein [Solirubrobacteraceae bacterium]